MSEEKIITLIDLFETPIKRRDYLASKVFIQNGHLQETDWMAELDLIGNLDGFDRSGVGELCLECDGGGVDISSDSYAFGKKYGDEENVPSCETCDGTGFIFHEEEAE